MASRAPYVEVFKGADGKWYGHRKARNGKITDTTGQGFTQKRSVIAWATRNHPDTEIRERSVAPVVPAVPA